MGEAVSWKQRRGSSVVEAVWWVDKSGRAKGLYLLTASLDIMRFYGIRGDPLQVLVWEKR